jgi:hypothetical protein
MPFEPDTTYPPVAGAVALRRSFDRDAVQRDKQGGDPVAEGKWGAAVIDIATATV